MKESTAHILLFIRNANTSLQSVDIMYLLYLTEIDKHINIYYVNETHHVYCNTSLKIPIVISAHLIQLQLKPQCN